MKRWLVTLLIPVFLLTGVPVPAGAGEVAVYVDNVRLYLEDLPVVRDGRTLAPMRGFFEALGATVVWEPETRTAVGTRDGITVRIPIGSTEPTVNGAVRIIDVPAQVINNRTYIPLRFVSDALGDEVVWDGASRSVYITSRARAAYRPYPIDNVAEVIRIPEDFKSIQAGINAASDGDALLVAAGTYYENVDFRGKNIIVTSELGPEETIINGQRNANVVMFHKQETAAVLHGFTITNGLAKHPFPHGGGISIRDASPTISHVIIHKNAAEVFGGGVYVAGEGAKPLIVDSVVSSNLGQYQGGGIAIRYGAAPIVRDNVIWGNIAEAGGGIKVNSGAAPLIERNVIRDNIIGFDFGFHHLIQHLDGINVTDRDGHPAFPGGILMSQNSTGTIRNNTITGNEGGGIGVMLDSAPVIEQNVITRNSSHGDGAVTGGILVAMNSSPILRDNTVGHNEGPDVWIDDTSLINGARHESLIVGQNRIAGAVVLFPLAALEREGPLSDRVLRVPGQYGTIQGAIDAAVDGDTIIVAPGVYRESIDFRGRNITVRSEGPESEAVVASTIIESVGHSPTVMFIRGEGRDAVIAGFTIRSAIDAGIDICSASPTIFNNIIEASGGTGILMNHPYTPLYVPERPIEGGPYTPVPGVATAPMIKGNVIRGCSLGGIYFYYASPVITENLITGNRGEYGGIWGWFSSPVITDNVISDNRSVLGGGLYFENFCRPVITGNVISGNVGELGGGIYLDSPTYGVIDGNHIVDNEAAPGSGLAINYGAMPRVTNNVIARNLGEAMFVGITRLDMKHNTLADNVKERGQPWTVGIFLVEATVAVTNSILYNSDIIKHDDHSRMIVTYSLIYGGTSERLVGEGNIFADPLFLSGGEYRLQPRSPAIDAGREVDVAADLDGNARPQGRGFDMGAYELTD